MENAEVIKHPSKEQLIEIRQHFNRESVGWMLCTVDWSTLTVKQIAASLDASESRVKCVLADIRRRFGVDIPHKRLPMAWSQTWYRKKRKELGLPNNRKIHHYMLKGGVKDAVNG